MNLYEKLLDIQISVDAIVKDGKNQSDKYDFASNENVVEVFRPLMNKHKLLLIPRTLSGNLHEGATKTGTARYLTELTMEMLWRDVESGEELIVPWYAQGVDLAGEKGVGKAQTYAEKYFLLKFFHVPTRKDDPDSDPRTGTGEKAMRGTRAAKETREYHVAAITQMLNELYAGDAEKIRAGLLAVTKNEARGYAGVDAVSEISNAALPLVYSSIKKSYEARMQHSFVLKKEADGHVD